MGSRDATTSEPAFPAGDAPVLAQVVEFLAATALDADPPAIEDARAGTQRLHVEKPRPAPLTR